MTARIVRIREDRRATAVNPSLPKALAWLRTHDPDGDRFELRPVVDYFKAHDAAHGETWEAGDAE